MGSENTGQPLLRTFISDLDFPSWITFGMSWRLYPGNISLALQFWSCSNSVLWPSQCGSCLSSSQILMLAHFQLPAFNTLTAGETVHLQPNTMYIPPTSMCHCNKIFMVNQRQWQGSAKTHWCLWGVNADQNSQSNKRATVAHIAEKVMAGSDRKVSEHSSLFCWQNGAYSKWGRWS